MAELHWFFESALFHIPSTDPVTGKRNIKGTSVFFIRLFGFAKFTATLKLVSRVGLP